MADAQLEGRFAEAMVLIYERAKRECHYNATRFVQMIGDHGALQTAKLSISADHPSDGFTALWECKRLDLTVEAHALKDEFRGLFTDEELVVAGERLKQYGRPNSAKLV